MNFPNINITPIEHKNQNYETAGDYQEIDDDWFVRISNMPDWRMMYLVMMHELTEMALTKHHNIDWKDIDYFDMVGEGKDHPDPGTLKSAPYHNEHMLATQIEKRLAKMLGVDWNEYNEALDALVYEE